MEKKDTRKMNSALNHFEFEQKKIILKSRPRMLFLELTRTCNLMCKMCRDSVIKGNNLSMPEDTLNRISMELFPYVECVDVRGWGESTLDDRLKPLMDTLVEKGVRVNLFTNLTTRTTKYWEDMGKRNINLAISLEAGTKDSYGKYRRGAKFDTFVSNLAALISQRQKSRVPSDIYFSVVVSDENLLELLGILRLASCYNIPLIRLNAITRNQSSNSYPTIGVSWHKQKDFENVIEEIRHFSFSSNVKIQYSTNLLSTNDAGFDLCIHPWTYVFVSYDGAVGFCDHLVAHPDAIIGNILRTSFMEIWNSRKYKEIRQEHIKKEFERLHKLGVECDWCYKNRYADCEYLFERSYIPYELR